MNMKNIIAVAALACATVASASTSNDCSLHVFHPSP